MNPRTKMQSVCITMVIRSSAMAMSARNEGKFNQMQNSRKRFYSFCSQIHNINCLIFCFSCESMSSIDEYLAKRRRLNNSSSGSFSSNSVVAACPNFIGTAHTNNTGSPSYSMMLKQLLNLNPNRYCCDHCIDYFARKICNHHNDELGSFLAELKMIKKRGYKFNAVMINMMMRHCTEHFDMHFHQFVLTKILNDSSVLEHVNEDSLQKFVNRRLTNVKQIRLGLSRKNTINA